MSDGDSVKKEKRKKGESVDRRNAPRPLTQILPLFIRRRFRGRQQRNTHTYGEKNLLSPCPSSLPRPLPVSFAHKREKNPNAANKAGRKENEKV